MGNFFEKGNYFISILLLLNAGNVICGTFEEETTLTAKEKVALDEFKKLAIPKISETSYLKHYLNDDLYFVRWIRATNLDVAAAERMFINHLKWRETQKFDTIDTEDWTEFERDYPVFTENFDKLGRPVSEMWFSDWPVRAGVLAGKSHQLFRWILRLYEMECRRLFKERAKGKHVANIVILIDLEGFALLEQACPACLPIYLAVANGYENHYPGILESVYLLNMPPTFNLILRTVKPVMRPTTRNALKSYVSKDRWIPVLDKTIDKSQRSAKFGGTLRNGF